MKYQHIVPAVFEERPNRFLAHARIGDRQVVCHVKNTGRCRELLMPGARILLQHHEDAAITGRKTEYSLIGVYKGDTLFNMDSQAPNQVALEWLKDGGFTAETGVTVSDVRREVTYGGSRFDLAFMADGKPAFMEVKGVTLEEDHIAKFPDAPTERGIKHLEELGRAAADGYEAFVLFVIQMKGITAFMPNVDTHLAFAEALAHAKKKGVYVLAYDCLVQEDELVLDEAVAVVLPRSEFCPL